VRWPLLAIVVLAAAGLGLAGGLWLAGDGPLTTWLSPATAPAPAPAAADPHAGHAMTTADPHAGHSMTAADPHSGHDMTAADPHAGHQHGGGGAAPDAGPPAAGDRKPLYYRNPMGLPDTSPVPKKDEMGMDYIPVYAEDIEAAAQGVVRIAPERVQMIGVRSEAARRRHLVRPVRAAGIIQFDERRTVIVSTRYEGWIERLLVSTTGERVQRGQPLMEIYSPDGLLAQQEYALLRQSLNEGATGEDSGALAATARQLLDGAEQRLRYLDVPAVVWQRLRAGGAPQATFTLPSPVSGTVIEKPALQGMRFMPGETLYKIVDMSTMWLIADVFEQDLAHVRPGQEAAITVKAYPGRRFTGRVAFIYPAVGQETRTARVRIELPNPDEVLKAEMYASVEIAAPLGPRDVLAVPDSAVIDNGNRQVVLIDLGGGRFAPRVVRLGERADGYVAVLDGLDDGERVVVSANFLIDAESNLKAALGSFAAQGHQH
jgi:Cu(I)/Ag(I) efflux system membrane fusion protein